MGSEPSDDELLDGAPSKPRDADALLQRGIVLQAIGRYTESLVPLQQAINLNSADPNVWLQIAIALEGPGRFEKKPLDQAMAALRVLRPDEEEMWFAHEVDQPIAPFAAYSRGVYRFAFKGAEAAERTYNQLVADYENATSPRVQVVVGRALGELANIAAYRGQSEQELRQLNELIARYGESPDSRLHVIVAAALRERGRRMAATGLDADALASWDRIVTAYGDEIEVQSLVAGALSLMAEKYGELSKTTEQLTLLKEIARRYADDPDPLLRWLAAEAGTIQASVLAATGDQQAAHDARLDVIRRHRHDRDPMVTRFVLNARIEEWMARHPRIPGAALLPARRLFFRVHRLLRRPNDGIATRLPGGRVAALGMALCVAATVLVVASIAGGMYAIAKEGPGRGTHSGLYLVSWIAAFAGQAVWLLGRRLRGRFSVGMLRWAPARRYRTLLASMFAFAVVWIAPSIDQVGEVLFFDPPRYIYRFLLNTVHVPKWLDIAMMCVIAPVGALLLAVLVWMLQAFLRALLGSDNALAEQVGDSFPVHVILPGVEED